MKVIRSVFILAMLSWLCSPFAQYPCNCKGYASPGGPCYSGPDGPAYDGPSGTRGANYSLG
jgi:hypothetical protein